MTDTWGNEENPLYCTVIHNHQDHWSTTSLSLVTDLVRRMKPHSHLQGLDGDRWCLSKHGTSTSPSSFPHDITAGQEQDVMLTLNLYYGPSLVWLFWRLSVEKSTWNGNIFFTYLGIWRRQRETKAGNWTVTHFNTGTMSTFSRRAFSRRRKGALISSYGRK